METRGAAWAFGDYALHLGTLLECASGTLVSRNTQTNYYLLLHKFPNLVSIDDLFGTLNFWLTPHLSPMHETIILVAGGTGARMGASAPKQFLPVNSIPILIHTLNVCLAASASSQVLVVMHPDHFDRWQDLLDTYLPQVLHARVGVCGGGSERLHSVQNGLNYLNQEWGIDPHNSLIAIHDAVRMLLSPALVATGFAEAAVHGSAIPCLPVKFSLRQMHPNQPSIAVDRSEYYEVQTPQTFQHHLLLAAFAQRSHDNFTDEASLFQQVLGRNVHTIVGEDENIKITILELVYLS